MIRLLDNNLDHFDEKRNVNNLVKQSLKVQIKIQIEVFIALRAPYDRIAHETALNGYVYCVAGLVSLHFAPTKVNDGSIER